MSEPSVDVYAYHAYLGPIAAEDARFLIGKDRSYRASWKAAGGRSAWHMLRRKMDRLIAIMDRPEAPHHFNLIDVTAVFEEYLRRCYVAEDIFAKVAEDPSGADGSALAEVRDLRRYLLLVEAEMVARGTIEEGIGGVRGGKGGPFYAKPGGMDHPFGYPGEEDDDSEGGWL